MLPQPGVRLAACPEWTHMYGEDSSFFCPSHFLCPSVCCCFAKGEAISWLLSSPGLWVLSFPSQPFYGQSWSVGFPFKANLAWLTQWLVRMVWFWTPSTSQTAILRECPSLEHASDRAVERNWISSRTTGEVHCPQEIPSRWTPQLSSDLYLLWLSPGMWFQNWPRFYPHS